VEYLGSGMPRILKAHPKESFIFTVNFIRTVFHNLTRNASENAGQNSSTPERKTNHDLCNSWGREHPQDLITVAPVSEAGTQQAVSVVHVHVLSRVWQPQARRGKGEKGDPDYSLGAARPLLMMEPFRGFGEKHLSA
jgi:hypothetical protein